MFNFHDDLILSSCDHMNIILIIIIKNTFPVVHKYINALYSTYSGSLIDRQGVASNPYNHDIMA